VWFDWVSEDQVHLCRQWQWQHESLGLDFRLPFKKVEIF
jgi:hypothetical protein